MLKKSIFGIPGTKIFVISLLYFAEGIPFGFINNTLSVFFRSNGMSLESIGLLSLVGLAWSLKVLWAPIIDRFGQKYIWIVGAEILIGIAIAATVRIDPGQPGILIWFVLGVMAVASATQDIAVDGYTIQILDDKELGMANGIRSGSYRVALIFSGGGIISLAEFVGWEGSFIGLSVIMLTLACVVFFTPGCRQDSRSGVCTPQKVMESWVLPLQDLGRKPNLIALLLFILLFKVGDAMMGQMISPFWVDRGFTRIEIGLISASLSPLASIGGAVIGGWLTSRWGIGRAIWRLGALQALSNLGYAYAALAPQKILVYSASIFESFTGGLGTAAFMAFLMVLCNRRFSATQYALFTTLFGFSGTISRMLSGFAAEQFGYGPFFVLTFFAACPAFILLPWVLPAIQKEGVRTQVEAD
ncbi:MAG: MFS transporter [Pseudomonadota bacterium]